uniref:Septin n=1 Tax=Phallusia mammillata TaxID=59560 RepID=A0A6F9DRA1_9ASCI|nr:neuronal-specific septin-3 [Phallusia mammillata]
MKTHLEGYVGIDTLTEQIRKKALRQGFEFNVMVVGGAGLGKSTLVNTLFKSKVSRRVCHPEEEYKTPKTIEIKSISHVIEEKGIRLQLTITDTPGFGDHVDNSKCWQPIMRHINDQYEKYLNEEISIKRRKRIPDTRVHCCIYFIPPSGHSLRPVDIEVMKRLVQVANVIPVIAKSDSLTEEEREAFKQRIQKDLEANEIRVYPTVDNADNDEDELGNNAKIKERIPFAVVGSTSQHQVAGKSVLGRKTRWGIVEVENEAHCEFIHLRNMIIRTHLQDLKEVTAQVHYELYRHKRLETLKKLPLDSVGSAPPSPNDANNITATKTPVPNNNNNKQHANNNGSPLKPSPKTPTVVKPIDAGNHVGQQALSESQI